MSVTTDTGTRTYWLQNGVGLLSSRQGAMKAAAVWLTWERAPMAMPRDQIAAWLRTARRTGYINKISREAGA